MTREADNYERGCEIVYRLVLSWKGEPPLFAFPPRDYALIADLRDIGAKLARNDGARALLDLLIKRTVERTGQAPTAMMLRVVLETLGRPIEWVSLDSLGLGELIGMHRGEAGKA